MNVCHLGKNYLIIVTKARIINTMNSSACSESAVFLYVCIGERPWSYLQPKQLKLTSLPCTSCLSSPGDNGDMNLVKGLHLWTHFKIWLVSCLIIQNIVPLKTGVLQNTCLLKCRDSILLKQGGIESVFLFFFFFHVCGLFICTGYLLKCPIDHSILST